MAKPSDIVDDVERTTVHDDRWKMDGVFAGLKARPKHRAEAGFSPVSP
jgi:hypothetical protein